MAPAWFKTGNHTIVGPMLPTALCPLCVSLLGAYCLTVILRALYTMKYKAWTQNNRPISVSVVASIGARGAECLPWQPKKVSKIWKKEEKIGKKRRKIEKKEEQSGRKGQNRDVFFTLPLLTNKAGYATDIGLKFSSLLFFSFSFSFFLLFPFSFLFLLCK